MAEDGIGCCYGILDNGLHFKGNPPLPPSSSLDKKKTKLLLDILFVNAASTALKCKTNATAFVNAVEDSLVQLAKICATGTTHASKAKL